MGRVLVTGAGGLIGRSVLRAMAAEGCDVTAHLGPPGHPIPPGGPNVRFALAEIDDAAAIEGLARDVEAVVHLAGPPSVAASFRDPIGYARAHGVGAAAVLAACRAHGVRRLVYVSSAEVYGRPSRNPVSEEAPFAPLSPYAAMKAAAEDLLRTGREGSALDIVVLRPFSVIGPPVGPHSVLGAIVRQALHGDSVSLHAPEVVRDFVAVEDVADAIGRALRTRPAAPFRAYNIGSGVGTSIRDLAAMAQAGLGKAPDVRTGDTSDRGKASDIPELIADARRAASELGWRAQTPLAACLAAIVAEARRCVSW